MLTPSKGQKTAALDAAHVIVREDEEIELSDETRGEFYSSLRRSGENSALAALFARVVPEGYEL